MVEDVLGAIRSVAGQVLEDMTFLFTEEFDGGEPLEADLVAAELEFKAEKSGRIRVVADCGLCREMAANMLGTDPDDPESDEKCRDALGEYVNVIGGILMEHLFPGASDHSIGVPKVMCSISPDELSTNDGDVTVSLIDEEERRMEISILWA